MQVPSQVLRSSSPPDAVLALKNSTTIHAFEVLQKFSISIPGTVALLGYDDFELAATLRPSITVVQQPVEAMGRTAAQLLFELLSEQHSLHNVDQPSSPRHVRLNTCLIRRSSCGCVPPAD